MITLKKIYLITPLSVLFFVLIFRLFVFESYRVPSSSMEPGILTGDFILVNKLKFHFNPPQAGDLVVFAHPKEQNGQYVKRIIAIPGDRIEVKGDIVLVNGLALKREALIDPLIEDGHEYYREENHSRHYIVRYNPNHFYRSDLSERVLKEDQYFVMGDNRDYSYDSRFWGILPRSLIVGKVSLVWFSFSIADVDNEITFRPKRLLIELN